MKLEEFIALGSKYLDDEIFKIFDDNAKQNWKYCLFLKQKQIVNMMHVGISIYSQKVRKDPSTSFIRLKESRRQYWE